MDAHDITNDPLHVSFTPKETSPLSSVPEKEGSPAASVDRGESSPAASCYETADEQGDDDSDGNSHITEADIRRYLNDEGPGASPAPQEIVANPMDSDDGYQSQQSGSLGHEALSTHTEKLSQDAGVDDSGKSADELSDDNGDHIKTSELIDDKIAVHGERFSRKEYEDHELVDLTSDAGDATDVSRSLSPSTDLEELEQQYKENRDCEAWEHGALAGHSHQCSGSSGPSTPNGSRSHTPETPHSNVEDTGVKEPLAKRQRISGPKAASFLMEGLDTADAVVSKSDLSQDQRDHRTLHNKARCVKPDMDLPGKNRFWIGILNPNVKIQNVRKESDFIWMKGHGGNTMKTIWHHWQAQTAADNSYRLQINDEFPEDTTIMAELDFYNDKHVIFRPVLQISLDDD